MTKTIENRRDFLPHINNSLYITDGGIETTLMFLEGVDLPEFAAFHLLNTSEGKETLCKYYLSYANLAKKYKANLVLESPTWRANPDWGKKLGYSLKELAIANKLAIKLLKEIRSGFESKELVVIISGCIGPRGDGYIPTDIMNTEEAMHYHSEQIRTFSNTVVDMVTAITMNYVEEAIGITLAAKNQQMPVVISFTVETDGNLATGQTLKEAIEQTDKATGSYPAYYMINCAHPTHFEKVIRTDARWINRLGGLRANASAKSHAELNGSIELDCGNPAELGQQYIRMVEMLPKMNVLGGCCGTDSRHIEQIVQLYRSYFG